MPGMVISRRGMLVLEGVFSKLLVKCIYPLIEYLPAVSHVTDEFTHAGA